MSTRGAAPFGRFRGRFRQLGREHGERVADGRDEVLCLAHVAMVVAMSSCPARRMILIGSLPRIAIQVIPVARRSWNVMAFRVLSPLRRSARVTPAHSRY